MSANNTRITRRSFAISAATAPLALSATSVEPKAIKSISDQVMHHVRALHELMQREAPESVDVTGFQFRVINGGLATDTIWASARGDDLSVWNMRPACFEGWKKHGDGYASVANSHGGRSI